MLRSALATATAAADNGESHPNSNNESYSRHQFLEYGWKKSDCQPGFGKCKNKSYGLSEGDEEEEESQSSCQWKDFSSQQQNGTGMELYNGENHVSELPLPLPPSPSSSSYFFMAATAAAEKMAVSKSCLDLEKSPCQEIHPFPPSDISPYIIQGNFPSILNVNNKNNAANASISPSSFSGPEEIQIEPYYYSPSPRRIQLPLPPPCSCACVINDRIEGQGIPRGHSRKESHLSLSIPSGGGREDVEVGCPRKSKKEREKQWDSTLDLIVPVSEASNYTTWTPISTSTPTYPSSLDGRPSSGLKRLPNSGRKLSELSPFSQTKAAEYLFCSNSLNHASLPGTSTTISPGTFNGDSEFSHSSPSGASQSEKQGHGGKKKKSFFCDALELDLRKICVICGLLIATAGILGVFWAMEMKTLQAKSDRKDDLVHKLLSEVPLIDGHNDLAWNLRKFLQNQLHEVNFDTDLTQHEPFSGSAWSHTDLIRLREGCIGAQLWSAYVPCSAQHLNAVQIAVEQIDVIQRLVDKYPNSLRLVTSVSEVEKSHGEKRIASLIGVEGGHAIGNSLAVLRMFYNLGARYLTLTHNCNTPWAGSASPENYLPERGGLTEFGKLVVLEMNRLGMMVDLAHVSFQTMKDGLAVSRAPVIFSHSAASALCNHSRNVPDEILKLVTANGGLVMVSFYNVFIACNESATMDDVIAHIEHIRQIAGVDHVGLGAGFDGINFVPVGLEDVSKYPDLISALMLKENKWSEQDLKKLVGINFLRVFKQVESVRDEWKRVGVRPIEEWIPRDDLEGHRTACSYHGAS